MSGFNPLCGANKLKRSGGVGYTEKGKVFTCDGKVDVNTLLNYGGVTMYRLTPDVLDLNTVETIDICESGVTGTITPAILGGVSQDADGGINVTSLGGIVVTFSGDNEVLSKEQNGTYAPYINENNCVKRVEFADTVHTIDPKYLGGVCLPCVTLTTIPTAEGAALTEAERAELLAAFSNGTPVVVKFNVMDGDEPIFVSHIFPLFGVPEANFIQSGVKDWMANCAYVLMYMGDVFAFYETEIS